MMYLLITSIVLGIKEHKGFVDILLYYNPYVNLCCSHVRYLLEDSLSNPHEWTVKSHYGNDYSLISPHLTTPLTSLCK